MGIAIARTSDGDDAMQGPLHGIKVLEVAQVWMGPAATALLSDWGADVIKVEPPHGDSMRREVPHVVPDVGGFNPLMEQCNRGKKSISLDIREPRGLEILYQLVEGSDVFVTNFLPRTCTRLGIDADHIRARNPRIVYARALGQGAHGPESEVGGYDMTSWWARSGLCDTSTTSEAIRPASLPLSLGDSVSSLAMAAGIAASLAGRAISGIVQSVDVSLLGTGLWAGAASAVVAASTPNDGLLLQASRSVLRESYRTREQRWIMIALRDAQWRDLCTVLGLPSLVNDPRFADSALRSDNFEACWEELSRGFVQLTIEQVSDRLASISGVWTPIKTMKEAISDPQVSANEYITSLSYEGTNKSISVVSSPVRFEDNQPTLVRGPQVGEHTVAILAELGISEEEIESLVTAGIAVSGNANAM